MTRFVKLLFNIFSRALIHPPRCMPVHHHRLFTLAASLMQVSLHYMEPQLVQQKNGFLVLCTHKKAQQIGPCVNVGLLIASLCTTQQ